MRLFVAVPLPPVVRDRLAMLRFGFPGARWSAPGNMHVTLRFIGEVDRAAAEDVAGALHEIAAPAFALAFNEIGHFTRGREVHTLWAGIQRCDALQYLHDKVESAVIRLGHEPEPRKFKPHVTLARLKSTPVSRIGAWLESHGGFSSPSFDVGHFTLFESFTKNEGPHYEALVEYPLRNGRE